MGDISAGQVVLASFPFSDLTAKKVRPCLVVGLADFNDMIVCQITSQSYESQRAVPLSHHDFSHGSIARDSYIRPDKLATLDKRVVYQSLGTLSYLKHREVISVLADIFTC